LRLNPENDIFMGIVLENDTFYGRGS